jgi:hypothetical protein
MRKRRKKINTLKLDSGEMPEKKKKILILAAALLLMPFLTNSTFALDEESQSYTIPVTAGDGLNDDCGTPGFNLNLTNATITASSTQTGATRTSPLGTHTLLICKYTSAISVSITMLALTHTNLVDSISNTYATYNPGTLLIAGTTMTATSDTGALDAGLVAWDMTPVIGTTSATWQPTLSVAVPSDAAVGDYTSTIYTSVV